MAPRAASVSLRRRPAGRGLLRRAMWAMARLRENAPLRASDLVQRFEISERTAYRDLDYLRDELRVPMVWDHQRRTFALTEPTALIAPVTLSRGELVAVFFAERVLAQYRGTPFEADLRSAFRKITDLLPEEVSVSPETLDDVLSLDIGPAHAPDAAVFAEVLAALRLRRVARIRYRSLNSGRTTDRRVRPYHIFNLRGDWYVAAFDERRRAVRDFALHRVLRVTLSTARYGIPDSFDRDRYLADAFAIEKGARLVEVAIRFAPRQARWIRERRWHPTARVQNALDGGCVVRFTVSGLGEVRRWALQFGAEAEVLAPAALRREVAEELEKARRQYSRDR